MHRAHVSALITRTSAIIHTSSAGPNPLDAFQPATLGRFTPEASPRARHLSHHSWCEDDDQINVRTDWRSGKDRGVPLIR